MPLVLRDRIKETTTTTGTGAVTLAGAATGFQAFSVIGNANTVYYAIAGQGTSQWEVGLGTYNSAGNTLSRDTVLESSNAGALVNFSAGTKDVFCTYPAGKAVTLDDVQVLSAKTLVTPIITENVQVISGNTTAVASRGYVLTASLTLTLPATPAAGDWVRVSNRSGTITAVIARNGSNIMGLAENMTVDSANAGFTLLYADATRGWVIL